MLDKMPALLVSGLLVLSTSEGGGENHLGKTAGERKLPESQYNLAAQKPNAKKVNRQDPDSVK